ncbi:alpha/beta hydrolase [Rhodococcus gannanensis]|uniref:Alpha/beta hydrolase n=1 Tax=Rhodococcus gannanensis TaxID=1960308 RepID=A0ABW4PB16_9NOCA
MSMDDEVAVLLEVLDAGFPRVETMTGAEARGAVRARYRAPENPEPVARIEERTVPGPAGDVPVRIYHPAGEIESPCPIVVFAHGGGFVFCDLDTHDGLCRAAANGIGAVVVSVDYRLAPESPWPAAAEDVYAVLCWASAQREALGGDRLVVAGDSAGGNLAAVTALMARDRSGPAVAAQVLLYPVIGADFGTQSYTEFATGHYNTRAAMRWYWDQYVPNETDRAHHYAGPLHAEDLSALPPAVVVTAGCDPLRSEGDDYANALAEQGVPVTHRRYDGAIHGFMTLPLDLAERARSQAWTDIRDITS